MQTIDLGNIIIGGDTQSADTQQACCGDAMEHHSDGCPGSQPCDCKEAAENSQTAVISSGVAGGICFNSCETYKCAEIGCIPPDGQGRILDLSFTLRGVCANCRIAVCVALYEVDSCGCETPCGLKMFAVGPASCGRCTDIPVSGLRFILPENVTGEGSSCCRRRCINVKVMTNYIDFGESARHF